LKRVALAVAAVILLAQPTFAGPWIKALSPAQKKAKDAKQLIFVDLFADWCGWCHRMEQEVFPSAVFQKATDDMVLLRLNTEDGSDGTNLARRFGVTTLPTFLILTSDLNVAGVIRGYAPPNEFVQSMNEVEKTFSDFQSRAKRESTFAKDYQQRLDLAREFNQHFAFSQGEQRLKKLSTEAGVPATIRDQAYYELAIAQLRQQKLADAIATVKQFSKVQNKGDAYERSRLLLGQVYMEQGNILAAANELRTFKTSFPNSPLIRTVEMILPDLERRLQQK